MDSFDFFYHSKELFGVMQIVSYQTLFTTKALWLLNVVRIF